MTRHHDGPGAGPLRFHDAGGALVVVLVVIVVAMAGIGFLLVHPSGQAAFRRFLNDASGNPTPASNDDGSAQADPGAKEELPPEARASLERAQAALDKGDFDAAQAACGQALALAPDSREAAELRKKIASTRAQAKEREQQVLVEAALRAARDLLADGELDRAEERLKEAFEQDPGSASALALKVKIAQARERRGRERASNQRRADDLSHEGTQALALGDADRALKLADQALGIDPGNMAAKNLRVQAELAKKRAEARAAAEAHAKSVATNALDGQGNFEIGRICWQSGDLDGAELYAKKALQAEPSHAEAKALLAKAIETRRRLSQAMAGRAAPPRDDAAVTRLAEAEKELAELKEANRERTVKELKDRLRALEEERWNGTASGNAPPRSRDDLLREFMEKLKAGQESAARSVGAPDDAAPDLSDGAVLAAQYVAQADEYRQAGKFDEARAAIGKALRALPGDVEIIMLMQRIEREAVRAEVDAGKPATAVAADGSLGPDASGRSKIGPDLALDTSDGGADDTSTGPIVLEPDDSGAAKAIRLVPDDERPIGAAALIDNPPEAVAKPVTDPGDGPREIERAIAVKPTELTSDAVSKPREVQRTATRRMISAQPDEIDRALPPPGAEAKVPAGEPTAAPSPSAPAATTPVRAAAERVPEVPADLSASVGNVLMALAELDVSLEREDLRGFERLLSEKSSGGAFSGGNVSRAEELANVRSFFALAEGIRVDRTTRPEDVKADPLKAEARSSYRITYSIDGAQMTRKYDAIYSLARERGAWRIRKVTVQGEAP
jgi:tetratricopeptide (TPR) repeat protein